MKKLFILIFSVCFMAAFSLSLAEDDSENRVPNRQFGAGVWVNGSNNYGAMIAYALSPNLHLGAGVALAYDTGYDDAGDGLPDVDGGTILVLNPFVRYYFSNIGNFFPFINGNLAISSVPSVVSSIYQDRTDLNVDLGGSWFPYNTLSVSGGIRFVNFNIDNSQAIIGIGQPFMCLEFWF